MTTPATQLSLRELEHSISSVQNLTKQVRVDLRMVRRFCPIQVRACVHEHPMLALTLTPPQNDATRAFLRRWGVEKMVATVTRMVTTRQRSAFGTWRYNIQELGK